MIRDTLIGLILLACLGLASMILGPTGVLVCSAACAIGFLAREVWDRRRREMENRRLDRIMRANREAMGIEERHREAMDLARPPSSRLAFPDRPIVPTRDAHFERPVGFAPTNVGYQAIEKPVPPPNRLVREGEQPPRRR